MKPAIANLAKWTEKTVGAIRHICNKKKAPCVAFSLIFYDPEAKDDMHWNYVIELAYDPHNPPSEEERLKLQQALEYVNEGVKRIIGGDPIEELFREVVS